MFWALRAGQKRGQEDVTEWKRKDPPLSSKQSKSIQDAAGFQASSRHSLHPVWKQQDHTVVVGPLGLARADELVYDALGCVMNISKLGFPEDESIWTGHGKTQLKTQSGFAKLNWAHMSV